MHYIYDFSWIAQYGPELLAGLGITLVITAFGVAFGLTLGLILAWIATHMKSPWHYGVEAYVEVIRNTPFMIQLFFIFFGLPQMGLKIDALTAAFIATAMNLAAYACEIFRAGIIATPKGQIEAGHSLGMSRGEIFRHIILTPALEKIWPALSSQIVIIMLGTSVVSQIAVEDLTFVASFIQSRNFRSFETYLFLLGAYLLLAFLLRAALTRLGQYLFSRKTKHV